MSGRFRRNARVGESCPIRIQDIRRIYVDDVLAAERNRLEILTPESDDTTGLIRESGVEYHER